MNSGTLGWKTTPSTMPTTRATMPITSGCLSIRPNLFGEVDVPDGSGGQHQTVTGGDVDAYAVRRFQQPQALQPCAAVERVAHRVRRTYGEDDIGAGYRLVVDENAAAGLAD